MYVINWRQRMVYGSHCLVGNAGDGDAIQVFAMVKQPLIAGLVQSPQPTEKAFVREVCANNAKRLPALDKGHYPRR